MTTRLSPLLLHRGKKTFQINMQPIFRSTTLVPKKKSIQLSRLYVSNEHYFELTYNSVVCLSLSLSPIWVVRAGHFYFILFRFGWTTQHILNGTYTPKFHMKNNSPIFRWRFASESLFTPLPSINKHIKSISISFIVVYDILLSI